MTGRFVAVVGPSGAGKDTLIAAARARLAGDDRVVFVRRVVSRADGGNEDHDTLDAACFPAAIAAGAFALHWSAHGLSYGIPARAVADVAAGRIVVANLSRGALDRARAVFPALTVVAVTCPAAVLRARLAARGREDAAAIERRLAAAAVPVAGDDVVAVDNGGRLGDAVDAFVAAILAPAPAAAAVQ